MRFSPDVFDTIRELVIQHGAALDLAVIARATNLAESDLLSRFGSLEGVLVAVLQPTPSVPPPLSAPPDGSFYESRAASRPFPQLREMFLRLTPAAKQDAPDSEPEITRLLSLPPVLPDAATR